MPFAQLCVREVEVLDSNKFIIIFGGGRGAVMAYSYVNYWLKGKLREHGRLYTDDD